MFWSWPIKVGPPNLISTHSALTFPKGRRSYRFDLWVMYPSRRYTGGGVMCKSTRGQCSDQHNSCTVFLPHRCERDRQDLSCTCKRPSASPLVVKLVNRPLVGSGQPSSYRYPWECSSEIWIGVWREETPLGLGLPLPSSAFQTLP